MRFLVLLFLLHTISNAFYCYTTCIDTINPQQATMQFTQTTQQELNKISSEIRKANRLFDSINTLNANKLENYVATRAIKESQLNELKEINFLLEQLIKAEEIRIKSLQIQTKSALNEN